MTADVSQYIGLGLALVLLLTGHSRDLRRTLRILRNGDTTEPTPGGALSNAGKNPASSSWRLGIAMVVLNAAFEKLRTSPMSEM
jgi:hypothetical protein